MSDFIKNQRMYPSAQEIYKKNTKTEKENRIYIYIYIYFICHENYKQEKQS